MSGDDWGLARAKTRPKWTQLSKDGGVDLFGAKDGRQDGWRATMQNGSNELSQFDGALQYIRIKNLIGSARKANYGSTTSTFIVSGFVLE